MFKIINKIKSNELSFQECLSLLGKDECWEFHNKGNLAMFILKKILPFLPEGQFSEKSFDDLIKKIDVTVSKILSELITSEEDESDIDNYNDELFKIFSKSPTYRKLYDSVNFLFKGLDLSKPINLTEGEYQNLKKKVRLKRITEIKQTYLKRYKKKIDKPELIKSYKQDKNLLNERLKKKKQKFLDKKLDNQIAEFIIYTRLFRLFYCSIFRNPLKDKSLQLIIPIHFEEDMKKTMLYNLFDKCKPKKIQTFLLRLQIFLVKNIVDDSYVYGKRYKERKNFLNEIVYKIDIKYAHLLWPIIEIKFPKLFERITDINSKDFYVFLEEKKDQIKSIFKNNNPNTNKWIDDLVLLFYMKYWFEDIVEIKNWASNYVHMNIFNKNGLIFKEMNGGFYPIIINLFYTCWGVLYDETVYFGNLLYVLFKYKELVTEHFDCKLLKSCGIMKKVCIKNFLVFS